MTCPQEYALRLVTRAGGDKLWPLTLKADVASDVVPFVSTSRATRRMRRAE